MRNSMNYVCKELLGSGQCLGRLGNSPLLCIAPVMPFRADLSRPLVKCVQLGLHTLYQLKGMHTTHTTLAGSYASE